MTPEWPYITRESCGLHRGCYEPCPYVSLAHQDIRARQEQILEERKYSIAGSKGPGRRRGVLDRCRPGIR